MDVSIVARATDAVWRFPTAPADLIIALQTFDCDPADVSNNQKFNIISDGSGNYTISPVHSDLCLEVVVDSESGITRSYKTRAVRVRPVRSGPCPSYGDNLEIRAVQNNQCMDVVDRNKKNYAQISVHACVNALTNDGAS